MTLEQQLFGVTFANPVLLAGGTAGYGMELDGVLDLDGLGGLVTKAVTPEPRAGRNIPQGEYRVTLRIPPPASSITAALAAAMAELPSTG